MDKHADASDRGEDAPEPASSDRLWLEVVILASSEDGAPSTDADPAGAKGTGPAARSNVGPTVLVVSREADLRAYIRECLAGAGLRILEAGELQAGLAALGAARLDLIILDAATAARAAPPHAAPGGGAGQVPRILVIDEPPSRGRATAATDTADTVLMKPFNARRLRTEVERRLRRTHPAPPMPREGGDTP